MRRQSTSLSIALTLLASSAAGRSIPASSVQGQKITVDGVLKEWSGPMTNLSEALEGSPSSNDPRVGVEVVYDDKNLYVALDVTDAEISRSRTPGATDDHATLVLAVPRADGQLTQYEIDLYPGDPGKVAGAVLRGGSAVPGAKIVEAPSKGGVTAEAVIPWSAFPAAARTRVGLRATVRYHDFDRGKLVARIATSTARTAASLPPLPTDPEQGLYDSLIKAKGLQETPARELYGNVSGDGFVERVAQYDGYLTIVGNHYRGGKEFYFGELGVSDAKSVEKIALYDFDGDGRDEIAVWKRLGSSDRYRKSLSVLRIGADEAPSTVFAQEYGIVTPDGSIENKLTVEAKKGGVTITLAQGEASGFDQASYREPAPGDMASALFPWEGVGSRTFAWKGTGFDKVDEKAWTPKPSTGPKQKPSAAHDEGPPAPPPPRPPSADELLDQVYALYRKDRGVGTAKPRFDFVTDVAGDTGPERVLVHQKDLVVFGKGYLGGTKYAFITMGVADPRDVLDVTARDLTGDGKAEVVVRAVLHAKASKELGGDVVDRQALFVYRATDAGVKRIFAAETGRALGDKRVIGTVAFLPGKKGYAIELGAGRAVGWTDKTYPFPADTTAAGGLEPLLLPWGDLKKKKYGWDGDAFGPR